MMSLSNNIQKSINESISQQCTTQTLIIVFWFDTFYCQISEQNWKSSNSECSVIHRIVTQYLVKFS